MTSGSVWSTHIVTPTEGIVKRLADGAPHPAVAAMATAVPGLERALVPLLGST